MGRVFYERAAWQEEASVGAARLEKKEKGGGEKAKRKKMLIFLLPVGSQCQMVWYEFG